MATLNASVHSEWERAENDYYATPPSAVKRLLEVETFSPKILEPACGQGHISEVLVEHWYTVESSDVVDRWYGEMSDFLAREELFDGSIITNPPFSMSQEFVEKALSLIPEWNKVAMLLRIQFLEWVKRHEMFKHFPPRYVYVFSRNIRCAKNGDFANATGNASTYTWVVWVKGYRGEPSIRWIL